MRILIATKNRGKFNEIAGTLSGDDVEIVFLPDVIFFDDSDFVEDGVTHEENARKKAQYYFDKLGDGFDFVLGEDSGIYVDALASELGVQTRRWGVGENASDEEWLEYFMKVMNERAFDLSQRGAKFVCNACLIGKDDGEGEICFEGETAGVITHEICSKVLPGLPLSSVFLPEGFDRVYAELSQEEKNAISHRGQAVSKVKKYLEKIFASEDKLLQTMGKAELAHKLGKTKKLNSLSDLIK